MEIKKEEIMKLIEKYKKEIHEDREELGDRAVGLYLAKIMVLLNLGAITYEEYSKLFQEATDSSE